MFFVCAPTRPFIDTLISWYMKGVEVVHIYVKFHLSNLQFPSFQISNSFEEVESMILG